MFVNNFSKCGLIFKILSQVDSLFSMYTPQRFPPHFQLLLHYLVKVENPKLLLISAAPSTNC